MKLSSKKSAKPGIITSLSGKITLHQAEGEAKELSAGMAVPPRGHVEIPDGASARVFHHGKFIILDEAGKHDLEPLLADATGLLRGFINYFDDALQAVARERGVLRDKDSGGRTGEGWGRDKDSGGRTGEGWGRDKDSGGRTSSGWGKMTDKSRGVSPKGSTVSDRTALFFWTRTAGEQDYVFRLFKKVEDQPILEKKEKDIALTEVDLRNLDIADGDTLYWQVQVGEETVTPKFDFKVLDGRKKQETLDKLSKESVFQEATHAEQMVMQAVALDRSELTHDALTMLAAALAAYPDNQFVRQMTESYYDYLLYKS